MDMLSQLWLPILLAGVAAWLWSFISWAAADLHRGDYRPIPAEDEAIAAVRKLGLPPGHYMYPFKDPAKSKDPAHQAKWTSGPVGTIWVMGPISMPVNMLLTFAWYLGASLLIGYLAGEALRPGAEFGKVMQVAGTAGVLAYTVSGMPTLIWFQAHRSSKLMAVVDGLVQGLATGAIFAAMWPKG